MAALKGNESYRGGMGGFVFYQLNAKTVVRVKRAKMSTSEKKKAAKTNHGRAAKGNVLGSQFGRALREINAYKHQADTFYHSKMTGFITQKLMTHAPEEGGLGTRILLRENVHHISSFTPNSEIPKKVLDALRKTKFKQNEDGITAMVPELPVENLTGSKADQYRVWVVLKLIDLAHMRSGWSKKIINEPVPYGEKVLQEMVFNPPSAKPDEVLMAVVGLQSLHKGKMVEDVRMNGFVYLGV